MKEEVIHLLIGEEDLDFIDELLDNYSINVLYDDRAKIEDLDKFIRKLENAGLMTKELEEFIDNYLQFDNDD